MVMRPDSRGSLGGGASARRAVSVVSEPAWRPTGAPAWPPLDRPTARTFARLMADPKRLLTGRRLPWYGGLVPGVAAVRAVAALGRTADQVLYPTYREQEVRTPTFIFANARSGTTFLHRLMMLDERFYAPKLYQALFPAVSLHRMFAELGPIDDRYFGGRLSKVVDWVDERFLSGWEGIHDLGLNKEEEDEGLFVLTLLSPAMTLLFPEVNELWRSNYLDLQDDATRHRLMTYYADTVKRELYAAGGDRIFLNKNVLFAHRVRSVLETFPDARFVYLVRSPYDAIGSMLSMWYLAWQAHSPDIPKDSPYVRELAQMCINDYRYSMQLHRELGPDQMHVVRYDDLVADPRRTVLGIYDHFGMGATADYRAKVAQATARARSFQSTHRYSLDEFGISRDFIRDQLGDLFEGLGLEEPRRERAVQVPGWARARAAALR